MAQLIVRNIDESVKANLRLRATRHGHSVEEEVRHILSAAACADVAAPKKLGSWFRATFKGVGLKEPIAEHRGYAVDPLKFT